MGRLDEGYSADSQQSHERTHSRRRGVREQFNTGAPKSDGHAEKERFRGDDEQVEWIGTNAESTGQYTDKAAVEVDRHRGIDSDTVIGVALALENLFVNPQDEQEEKKYVPKAERRHKHKPKNKITQSRDDWEMEM